MRSKEHKIAAESLAAEVGEFAKVAEEHASSTGGATGAGSSKDSGSATGGSDAAKTDLASFLSEEAKREELIAKEAQAADAMADENADVVR